ncbi:MAG: anti-sigma factor [Desulfuromonas sp.]|nr:MAG: anti-sigma factor [Desulfuromonas sp.]
MKRIEVDIRVPNQTRYLSLIGKIGEDVARTLRSYRGDREELAYHINLVLTEAMTNAIHHANEGDPEKEVHITIAIINDCLSIKVYDEGQGFDVSALDPVKGSEIPEHGRGVYIIRSLMDRVCYRRLEEGHVLEMEKNLT